MVSAAAVAAVVYALFLGLVLYRTLTWRHIIRVSMDTIETSAAILMIVAAATIFAWILTANQVATILGDTLLGLTDNKTILLLIIMVIVLAIGLFMETIAAITILVPVLMPIASSVGIDPIHLGIIVILNLMLGLLTPPIGMVLYVLSKVSGVKFEQCVKATMPFLVPLIIVLLLIGQFNSFRRGGIILMTIPLALIGVVIGLLITGQAFGFMSMLGVISLAGIVINNAIVLIDRFKIEIEENGLPPNRAIIEACQQRLRPILLTTLTTVGGMIPLWLGGGPLWESMAVTIIFGIIFATALTLGVVPLLYSLFFRVSFKNFSYG